jgi:hypothetical protein
VQVARKGNDCCKGNDVLSISFELLFETYEISEVPELISSLTLNRTRGPGLTPRLSSTYGEVPRCARRLRRPRRARSLQSLF